VGGAGPSWSDIDLRRPGQTTVLGACGGGQRTMNARGSSSPVRRLLTVSSGEIRLRGLIALMDCFAVPESTVRVVVARLRKEGAGQRRTVGRPPTCSPRRVAAGGERLLAHLRAGHRAVGRAVHMVIYSVAETERALREQLRRHGVLAGVRAAVVLGLAEPARPDRRGDGRLRGPVGDPDRHLQRAVRERAGGPGDGGAFLAWTG